MTLCALIVSAAAALSCGRDTVPESARRRIRPLRRRRQPEADRRAAEARCGSDRAAAGCRLQLDHLRRRASEPGVGGGLAPCVCAGRDEGRLGRVAPLACRLLDQGRNYRYGNHRFGYGLSDSFGYQKTFQMNEKFAASYVTGSHSFKAGCSTSTHRGRRSSTRTAARTPTGATRSSARHRCR